MQPVIQKYGQRTQVHRHKTCCHCGRETHAQPQDFNHDTGYGHCLACLAKEDWYVYRRFLSGQFFGLHVFIARPRCGAPLYEDDSDPKVIELYYGGRILEHKTLHSTLPKILEMINGAYSTDFTLESEVKR